jgi:predicted DNA-binding transcriptional regulator AlpA
MADDPDPNELLSYKDIADLVGVQVQVIRNYRTRGKFPPADDTSVPDRPRWRRSTVIAWDKKRPGPGFRTDLHG